MSTEFIVRSDEFFWIKRLGLELIREFVGVYGLRTNN
jgi:hypothetical protein